MGLPKIKERTSDTVDPLHLEIHSAPAHLRLVKDFETKDTLALNAKTRQQKIDELKKNPVIDSLAQIISYLIVAGLFLGVGVFLFFLPKNEK